MAVLAIALLLAPIVAGWVGVRLSHSSGARAVTAWLLGAGLFVFAAWFGGRADERPVEGVVAGVGAALCIVGLWRLRRNSRVHA